MSQFDTLKYYQEGVLYTTDDISAGPGVQEIQWDETFYVGSEIRLGGINGSALARRAGDQG